MIPVFPKDSVRALITAIPTQLLPLNAFTTESSEDYFSVLQLLFHVRSKMGVGASLTI